MMGEMGREATLRILKDGVDPESPNLVERDLDAAMSAEYSRNMELVERLKAAGKSETDPSVVALEHAAEESFNFAADREKLVSNIRKMTEVSAVENVELNNIFLNANEDQIKYWILLLLTDIQTMFGDDRYDRILDIYSLGSLVDKNLFDKVLKKYGDDIGFDAKAEFYQAMPSLRESDEAKGDGVSANEAPNNSESRDRATKAPWWKRLFS